MSTAEIREKLKEYIDVADEKKVQAIYTMVENDIFETKSIWDDDEFLNEMDRRLEELESGKVKGIRWEDVQSKF